MASTSSGHRPGPHHCEVCVAGFHSANQMTQHLLQHALLTQRMVGSYERRVNGSAEVFHRLLLVPHGIEEQTESIIKSEEVAENDVNDYADCEMRETNAVNNGMENLHEEKPVVEADQTIASPRQKKKKVIYQCNTCGVQSPNLGVLQIHMNTHYPSNGSGSGSIHHFICTLCSISFTSLERLKRHTRAKHGGDLLYCNVCSKTFNQKEALKMHMASHAEKYPYTCEYCGRGFSRKKLMEWHINNRHFRNVGATRPATGSKAKTFICSFCKKVVKGTAELLAHARQHSTGNHHLCKICGDRYSSEAELSDHAVVHTTTSVHMCIFCQQIFMHQYMLVDHWKKHFQVWKCQPCNQEFSTKITLLKHMDKKHKNHRKFKCYHCPQSFDDIISRKNHISKMHTEKWKYNCDMCDKGYNSEVTLANHREKHKSSEKAVRNASDPKTKYPCSLCGKTLSSVNNSAIHFIRDHNVQPTRTEPPEFETYGHDAVRMHLTFWKCNLCSTMFTDAAACQEHAHSSHGAQVKCILCEEGFSSTEEVLLHQKEAHPLCDLQNTGVRDIQAIKTIEAATLHCKTCNKYYYPRYSFWAAQHGNSRETTSLQCTVCEKVMKSHFMLKLHMKTHNSESWPPKCEYCEKTFTQERQLTEHVVRVHTKNFPFPCDQCEMGFLHQSKLERHKLKHSGERNCICEICSKSFQTKSDLKRHMVSKHSEERSFMCEKCGKGYPDERRLSNHVRQVHNKEKSVVYACKLCMDAFKSKHVLSKHISSKHPNEDPVGLIEKIETPTKS